MCDRDEFCCCVIRSGNFSMHVDVLPEHDAANFSVLGSNILGPAVAGLAPKADRPCLYLRAKIEEAPTTLFELILAEYWDAFFLRSSFRTSGDSYLFLASRKFVTLSSFMFVI